MSLKETTKAVILDRVVKGEMTAAEGAARLKMSKRHIFRMKAKIRESDMSALAHGNRCRKPSNALPEKTRALVRDKGMGEYQGASLSHMEELFEKNDGLSISSKSIGRILKEAGATNPHARKSPKKFRRRKRRERFGSLIQVDASPFDWLENGEMLSLHGAIDDATGTVLSLRFEKNECSAGYLHILEETLRRYGVPASLYSDRHSIFFSPKGEKLSEEDIVEGRKAPLTQYGKILDTLGIEHIPARTPQAKGRIERLWGTLQSRLTVEMRICGIKTLEEANRFLRQYTEQHNAQFAEAAADAVSDFLPCPAPELLRLILGYRDERKASSGSEISWKGAKYQLVDEKGKVVLLRRGETVTVVRPADGTLFALREGEKKETSYGLIPSLGGERQKKKGKTSGESEKKRDEAASRIPPMDHPWRQNWWEKKSGASIIEEELDPMVEDDGDCFGSIRGVRVS